MKGSIVKRSKTNWALVVDEGRDSKTKKRKQKWVKFHLQPGKTDAQNKKLAEAALAKLLTQMHEGTYVDDSKVTLVEWVRDWHKRGVAARVWRPETARIYLSMIEKHIATSDLAHVPLQKIRKSALEHLYSTVKLTGSSVSVLHSVIVQALSDAVSDKLLIANPAREATKRPRPDKKRNQKMARLHCWSASEANSVLAHAKDAGPQVSAFFAVLLDTGCRKSEALGLTWDRVDLDAGKLTIDRQLEARKFTTPEWGPTKTEDTRTLDLDAETVVRLRVHRKQQRTLMMANRTTYQDFGLVFAKEQADQTTPKARLGQPCPALTTRHFQQVVKAAGVKVIKVHGTRHTCATLLLETGVSVRVVADRLGHADVSETLNTYVHTLQGAQKDAAARLGGVLYGGQGK